MENDNNNLEKDLELRSELKRQFAQETKGCKAAFAKEKSVLLTDRPGPAVYSPKKEEKHEKF